MREKEEIKKEHPETAGEAEIQCDDRNFSFLDERGGG
jgi:hypothetical protein